MRRKSTLSLLAAAGLVFSVAPYGFGLTTTAAQAQVAVQPGQSIDYFVDAFGDALDWSGPEDLGPSTDVLSMGIASSRVENGQVSFTVDKPSFWFFLQGGYADSIPTGKDASGHPVDAGKYNRLVMRISSSANMSAGVLWFACSDSDNCGGGIPLEIRAGTHEYDLSLGPARVLSRPWSGKINSMRLDFAPTQPTQLSVDWMRLTNFAGGNVTQWNGPTPDILDPDVTGGDDYATIARNGDAWDFEQATDVHSMFNATGTVNGGFFNGSNAGPAMNDPSVTFKVPKAFKGDDFHRATVKWSYDGPFSLRDQPGAGTNARLVWRIAGTPPTPNGLDLQESRDIVMYPNENQFTVDLKTNPASLAVDPRPQNKAKIGWAGQMIELFRFDPNEDPGHRTWKIDSVKLAADDAGEKSFDIRLADKTPGPATVADVYVDSDNVGFDGTQIASNVDLSSGQATVHWEPPAGTVGTFWVHVTMKRGSNVSSRYSGGPVQIGKATGPGTYTFGPAVGGPASQINIPDAPAPGAEPAVAATVPAPAPVTTVPAAIALTPPKTGTTAQPTNPTKPTKPTKSKSTKTSKKTKQPKR